MKNKYLLLSILSVISLIALPQCSINHKSVCNQNFVLDASSKSQMHEYGNQMKRNKVSHIYFVHGTWAGDSPFGILSRLPGIKINRKLKKIVKINVDNTMGDLGNYTDSYCDLFKQSIGNDIPCDRINWGSGNFHSARVKGSIILIKEIARNIQDPSVNDRILLIGHSHAGQLFALLTTFLEEEELALMETDTKTSKVDRLVEVVGLDESIYKDIEQLKNDLKKIDKVFLDLVTFGTPPRYHWGKTKRRRDETNYRLVNVINHRNGEQLVSKDGLWKTKSGDYVQQWGVGGTDIDINIEENSDLGEIIGKEQYSISAKSVTEGCKRHKPGYGKTLLIDYGDKGGNPVETVLGHGLYTCKEKMLFNTELIVDNFYKD